MQDFGNDFIPPHKMGKQTPMLIPLMHLRTTLGSLSQHHLGNLCLCCLFTMTPKHTSINAFQDTTCLDFNSAGIPGSQVHSFTCSSLSTNWTGFTPPNNHNGSLSAQLSSINKKFIMNKVLNTFLPTKSLMKIHCDKQLLVFAEYPWKLFTLVHPQINPELNGIS